MAQNSTIYTKSRTYGERRIKDNKRETSKVKRYKDRKFVFFGPGEVTDIYKNLESRN